MEGNVMCSYLRSKFSSTLDKAEADLGTSSQIISGFRSIESLLINRMNQNSGTLINTMNQNSGTMVNLLYELMDALSECTIFVHEATSNKGLKYLFRQVRFENKMKSRLDKIERNLRDFGPADQHQIGNAQAHPDVPDPSLIMGFESQVREIEEMIMSGSRFTPIGIVGLCGSGKTALAREVFTSSIVEKTFFPRIWVSLSGKLYNNQALDLKGRILNDILRQTGHDASDLAYGDYSVVQLLEMLRLRLTGKNYLIVLDDAWRMDEWFADLACCRGRPEAESFTNGLPKESGGAVIVTSQGKNVIRRMVGEKHVIRPQLSDEFYWTIFMDGVKQQGKIPLDDPALDQMKESVINNCRGLPLVAHTLATLIPDLIVEESHPVTFANSDQMSVGEIKFY